MSNAIVGKKGFQKIDILHRFYSKVKKTDECWLWLGAKSPRGYGDFWNGEKIERAHRWIYRQTFGAVDNKFICHKCDNPSCVKPDHLFAGTHEDNMNDMAKKKRHHIYSSELNKRKLIGRLLKSTNGKRLNGEKHGCAKLSNKDVIDIIRSFKWITSRKTNADILAKKYNVSKATIRGIINGDNWSSLSKIKGGAE